MKNKVISLTEAAAMVRGGMSVMTGGFLGVGAPNNITDELLRSGVKDLTLISNDTAMPEIGVGKLVANRRIKRFIGSHIGTNPETGKQMAAGELEVTLIPQGTMAERMRAKGAGLGAVLTRTGLGTPVAEGKQSLKIDGREYLLEMPLGAELAIIYGSVVDRSGNVCFHGTTRNFNVVMAKAADVVIVEARKLVETGEIDPNHVVIPGMFIDYIVEVEENGQSGD